MNLLWYSYYLGVSEVMNKRKRKDWNFTFEQEQQQQHKQIAKNSCECDEREKLYFCGWLSAIDISIMKLEIFIFLSLVVCISHIPYNSLMYENQNKIVVKKNSNLLKSCVIATNHSSKDWYWNIDMEFDTIRICQHNRRRQQGKKHHQNPTIVPLFRRGEQLKIAWWMKTENSSALAMDEYDVQMREY